MAASYGSSYSQNPQRAVRRAAVSRMTDDERRRGGTQAGMSQASPGGYAGPGGAVGGSAPTTNYGTGGNAFPAGPNYGRTTVGAYMNNQPAAGVAVQPGGRGGYTGGRTGAAPGGGAGTAPGSWQEQDVTVPAEYDSEQGYTDARDLLYERAQQLLSEGATSTAELEALLGQQYDATLDQGLGSIMAQAGAGGMGLGGGMQAQAGDFGRQVAQDRSTAIIDARRQAEQDLMDRLGVANDLFGSAMSDREREDFWAMVDATMGGETGPQDTNGDGVIDGQDVNDAWTGTGNPLIDGVYEAGSSLGIGEQDLNQVAAIAVQYGIPVDEIANADSAPITPDGEVLGTVGQWTYWRDPRTGKVYRTRVAESSAGGSGTAHSYSPLAYVGL